MWFDPAVVEAVRNLLPEGRAYRFAARTYLGSILAGLGAGALVVGPRH